MIQGDTLLEGWLRADMEFPRVNSSPRRAGMEPRVRRQEKSNTNATQVDEAITAYKSQGQREPSCPWEVRLFRVPSKPDSTEP